MKKFFKSRKAGVISCLIVALAVIIAYKIFVPNVVYVKPSFVADFSDERNVVAFADNIFVGVVEKKIGSKKLIKNHPETQYRVRVLENIKGNLQGSVKINHEAGYNGATLVMFEGDRVLEEGKTYLFAARYNAEEDWYTVLPIYGNIPIDGENKKAELVAKFRKAAGEEKR